MFENLVDFDIDKKMATAVRNGDIAGIQDAISRGADINELGSGIPYALIAAKEGKWDTLIFLFKNGVARDVMDRRGWTPAHLVAEHAEVWVAEELSKLNVALNEQDFNIGETPLMVAIKSQKRDMIRFLVKSGIPLNTKDKENKTALHHAAILEDKETFMLLIESGAKLNINDITGKVAADYIEDIDWKMSLPQIERISIEVKKEKEKEKEAVKEEGSFEKNFEHKVEGLSKIKKKNLA